MENKGSNFYGCDVRIGGEMLCCRQKYVGSFRKGLVVLDYHDIYYFESYKRVTHVHTKKGRFRVSGSLERELDRLPKGCFSLIHQNYLVNFSHITKINGRRLTLSNGKSLEISVGRSQGVQERFQKYLEHICFCSESDECCSGY